MSRTTRYIVTGLAFLALAAPDLRAGSYNFVSDRVVLDTAHPQQMPAFSIVHPPGYDGTGGTLEVGICVLSGSEILIPVVKAAIDSWNDLEAETDNCENCVIFEEPPPAVTSLPAFSTLLHELGHCAFGLDHINQVERIRDASFFQVGTCDIDSDDVCGESSSFTESANATEAEAGAGAR